MKKIIALLLVCLCQTVLAATDAKATREFGASPWELVSMGAEGGTIEKIYKLSTPEGWIVWIYIDPFQGNKISKFIYVPDPKHEWKLPPEQVKFWIARRLP